MAGSKSESGSPKLDETDRKILKVLQKDARITNATLSKRVGISPPSALERVRKLERLGVITGYVALLDPRAVNKSISAIVHIGLASHTRESLASARDEIVKLPEVLCCWYTAGEEDFVLKVLVSDMAEYERFVSDRLSAVAGVSSIRTAFVLSIAKESTEIPLDGISTDRKGPKKPKRK